MPFPGDGGPRGYHCAVCNRPAARYDLRSTFHQIVDVCDVCAYYVFTQQWDVLGQRNASSGMAAENTAPPWPYPEPDSFPI